MTKKTIRNLAVMLLLGVGSLYAAPKLDSVALAAKCTCSAGAGCSCSCSSDTSGCSCTVTCTN